MGTFNPKSVEKTLKVKTQNFITYNLPKFEKLKIGHPQKLPFSRITLRQNGIMQENRVFFDKFHNFARFLRIGISPTCALFCQRGVSEGVKIQAERRAKVDPP